MKLRMLVLLVLFSFSCQDIEKVEEPKDLIPEDKMVEILTDLSLVNSAKNFNRRMLEETGFDPEEFLYERHNVDSLSLAESTKFYAKDPANLERIYTKVQQNLEALKADLEEIRQEELRIEDSIKAANPEEDSLGLRVLPESRDSLVPVREIRADTLMPDPQMRRSQD